MYCQKCGRQIDDEAIICPGCGVPTINYGQDYARKKHNRPTKPPVEECEKYQMVNPPKLFEKQKRNKQQGIWKLIVAGVCILAGLNAFAISTLLMDIYIVLAGILVIWWINSDWKPKTKDNSADDELPVEKANVDLVESRPDPEPKHIEIQEKTEYEHIKIRLVGVSFKNPDGKSRQSILRHMRFRDPPFDKKFDAELYQYEYEGEPAISVKVNDMCIGHIPKEKAPFFVDNWSRLCGITHIDVIGGGISSDGEQLHYGAEIIVKIKKQV